MPVENPYQRYLASNRHARSLIAYEPIAEAGVWVKKGPDRLLNFASNDYLGLNKHPALIARSQAYAEQWGVGTSSSRLVAGNLHLYGPLEQKIAEGIGCAGALILGTGFQANTTILEALLDPKVLGQKPLVFCDKYCHFSLYAGIKPHVPFRFHHNDLQHLEELLYPYQNSEQPKFIVAESVYSMEGDQVDLGGLIALAKRYQAMLYLDDAHGVGVYGHNGWGMAADYAEQIDLVMGTFSKAFGSFGAYVGCSLLMREYLINRCKGLIYSTALPPTTLGAMTGAIELLSTLQKTRERLFQQAERLRLFMQQQGLNYGSSTTAIVPWIIGDAKQTVLASHTLEKYGILATAMRPPTIPEGKSRIRFCLSAAHTDADIEKLMTAITKTAMIL